ncbi:MAG: glycosyltransferase family 39 protein, partial [Pseudomonadota bacterium]
MVLGMVLFLSAGLLIVQDYGMNIDSQKNFREGEMNLDYFLTGQVDQRVLQWQMHGAFIFMAADAVKRLLHDTFHLYDPVAARHVLLPFLTALFMLFLFFFVKRHWSPLHGVISVGVLLTFPSFWGHSFNNLKDVPLLIFFSLSIMSFVDWRLSGETKFLYRFFIFLGVALSIKTYAFLAPLIVLFWIALKPNDSDSPVTFPPRRIMILHASVGVLISVAIVLTFYAPAFWGV